jgi:DNA-binding NarL/FixJ family response regulator
MGIRILIASDHPLTRTGLRETLKAVADFELVAEADAPGPVAELCRRFSVDVIIFDITIPGTQGLRAAAELLKEAPEGRVLVLAANQNLHYVGSLLALGIPGYILRKATAEELFLAVRHIASGRRYLDPRLSDSIGERLGHVKAPAPPTLSRPLSPREAQVLRAVARGFTSDEIGGQLQLSAKTVETYRGRIYEKLGLHSRADLVHYALAAGLFEELPGESS